MPARSQELRAKNRRVFAVSYLTAALVIGALFLWWSPEYEVVDYVDREAEPMTGALPTSPLFVLVRFGPPAIFEMDGTSRTEPAERVLEAGRVIDLPPECREAFLAASLPVSGALRVHVDGSGDASVLDVDESTGIPCGDEAMTVMADALLHEWLRDAEFAAPAELSQPVALLEVAEPS